MLEKQEYKLNQIYFYLTEGCNLACRHCWIAPKYQFDGASYPALELELFRSIIEQAKPLGLSGVKLTGGEPLLHPDIMEILKLIQSEGLRLSMETNGILCTPEVAQEIKKCNFPFVSVSLDGTDPETHEWVRGVKGCFERAKEGIRNLVSCGINPQTIMTIMRRNKSQMASMVKLAESLGANSLKFNIVQPTARGERMHESGETLSLPELVELGEWVENTLSKTSRIPVIYSHPMAFKPLSKIFGQDGDGCSACGIIGILGVLANGSYALCGIGETVPELIFGHASKDLLKDIWENNSILREIRDGIGNRFKDVCGCCVMKNMCLGNCIAQNYYSSKNLWATYWYCEEAQKLGLFPETRLI